MHQNPKSQECTSGCHLTINYKTFLLLADFSRCPAAIPQGQGPFIGQKINCLKVPLFGTLNLGLKMPEKMQKTRNESDNPELRSHPKTGEKWPIFLDIFTQEQYAIGCIFIFELLKILGHPKSKSLIIFVVSC